jgi:hypothetical protein
MGPSGCVVSPEVGKSRLLTFEGSRVSLGFQSSSTTRWTTPDSAWTFPVAPRNVVVLMRSAYSENFCDQMTRFTKPVSSSRVMKVTPEAVPGLCRQMTSPA